MRSSAPVGRPDPGLQPERTRLAWQRTAISVTVCAVVISRFVAVHHLVAGVALGVAALGCGAMVGLLASRRGRRATAAFWSGAALPDGRIFAATALLIMVAGVGALVLLAVA